MINEKKAKLIEEIVKSIVGDWDKMTPKTKRVLDEIMQAINDYEASVGHCKIYPLKDKPGFYAVDEQDINVVMAVFKGEKEIAEGEWYLINLKEQEPEKMEGVWYSVETLPNKPMMCVMTDGTGYNELVYWDGHYWYLRDGSEMRERYFSHWKKHIPVLVTRKA